MSHSERIDLERYKRLFKERLLALMDGCGDFFPLPGVGLYRRHADTQHKPIMYKPVVAVIAQGRKCVRMGHEEFIYGDSSYFIAGVDMPTACSMMDCSPERPFLSMTIDLDKALIARLAAEVPPARTEADPFFRGATVVNMEPELMDALLRLVELADTSRQAQAQLLAPLIIKEIHLRLLAGPFGSQLRTINTFGTPCNQISRAVSWLRENYSKPLQVDDLARQVHMATSTFHKHFKEVTTLSPLQYQKRLRLEEAQRLMLAQGFDASRASLAVGYESLTQFTREYKRLFGDPPRRDVTRIRNALHRQAGTYHLEGPAL